MLFPLERLIDRPEKPALVCIRHDETIRDALKCMIENDFTQLPVVDKDQDLIGITGCWATNKKISVHLVHATASQDGRNMKAPPVGNTE